jgi:hypothetical protein
MSEALRLVLRRVCFSPLISGCVHYLLYLTFFTHTRSASSV